MAGKHLRRSRRLARQEARSSLREAARLRPIALAAIRYVAEIDAPDLHEPWSIAHRRNELADLVHALQGRPERTRRDVLVKRPGAGEVVPIRLHTQPPAPQKKIQPAAPSKDAERLTFELEVARRALHDAGAKYGAEANKYHRDPSCIDELRAGLDSAARAFAEAGARIRARRSA